MAFFSTFTAGFFLLIIITGIFTSLTDLRHQKIRNNHLIFIAVAAVILTITKGALDRSIPVLQLSSTACAIIVAWIFYKYDLWRGGDAKLFVLLSFLMPATGYESRIFLPCIALFVNSFITALIFFGLVFLKTFFADPRSVTGDILKTLKERRPGRAIAIVFCITWVIFPLLHACGLSKYNILLFLAIYLVNIFWGYQIDELSHSKFIAIVAFACGLLFHYKFLPDFFLWKNLIPYLGTIIIYPVFALILSGGTERITKSDERVPFSPFLFVGCLLSYTSFLWWVMSLQHPGK